MGSYLVVFLEHNRALANLVHQKIREGDLLKKIKKICINLSRYCDPSVDDTLLKMDPLKLFY